MQGCRARGGEAARSGRIAPADATAVARLRAAGAIVLGKTNVGERSEAFGATLNPHDPTRTPTGSSSGEAALVAAAGSALGLGSDSGGSLRQPAARLRLVALRPTTGRVPLTGHVPVITPMLDPRTVIGPIARRVEDLVLALRLLEGPDHVDPSVVPMPWTIRRRSTCAACRSRGGTSSRTATRRRRPAARWPPPRLARGRWRDRGGRPTRRPRARLPADPHVLVAAGVGRWRALGADGGPATSTRAAVQRFRFEWDLFRRDMARFMGSYDAVLTPAAAWPAVRTASPPGRSRRP